MNTSLWKKLELLILVVYASAFYLLIIRRSLQIAHDYSMDLKGLRAGWISNRLNDFSDAQWRNFRGNLPILTIVLGIFTLIANTLRFFFQLKSREMAIIWFCLSLIYLIYLHGACIVFIFFIVSINFLVVKAFANSKYFSSALWIFNLSILLCNRIFEGYLFSSIGKNLSFLDNYRGTFRWHICFNFVVLRMISFGYDYHWSCNISHFDQEKHTQRCSICSSGKTCYLLLQERELYFDGYSFMTYLCYLIYAPLYISGPIISFNAFASQLHVPQKNHSPSQVLLYGFKWIACLILMEVMTHFFYYNAFATSGMWKKLSPFDIFIIGYGVLNFMWLKFLLIWRYFRLWSLIGGIESPENMPRCINNCYDLESFWKSWHASFNKWLVRYIYIPLGGYKQKMLNVWVIFTFVAIWHDLEWKLVSWAWLTCLFMIPEIIIKSTFTAFKSRNTYWKFALRELKALVGAVTITSLMVTNLVGYVIGFSNIRQFLSQFYKEDGLAVPCGIFATFYVGTKLMFHVQEAKQKYH
ncbi:putative Glycerol uptake protein [Zostera marina]|uniref:Putative Glycerol uptake protein n=1 Tax=Zostera marina TaxID=29655 RepID=A0A0K9P7T4_ZOSMR|nr:putative Glycerol uptake protein [Zostera marina]